MKNRLTSLLAALAVVGVLTLGASTAFGTGPTTTTTGTFSTWSRTLCFVQTFVAPDQVVDHRCTVSTTTTTLTVTQTALANVNMGGYYDVTIYSPGGYTMHDFPCLVAPQFDGNQTFTDLVTSHGGVGWGTSHMDVSACSGHTVVSWPSTTG